MLHSAIGMSPPRITAERSEILDDIATKSYTPTSRIRLPGSVIIGSAQWEVHRSLRGGVASHTQTRIYSTIVGVCFLWLVYRFVKDFFWVEDAYKIKEMKRLPLTKEVAELEEEMDVTQPDVSFGSGGLTEEEARNEISRLEAGFKLQEGNNKTTVDTMGRPAIEVAVKSGGRRLSLEAQTRRSPKSLDGRRLNEGKKDSGTSRSIYVVDEATSRVSEGKDVSSGKTELDQIPMKVRRTSQSKRSSSVSTLLPPCSPELRAIDSKNKKDAPDQDSVGIVEGTRTTRVSEKQGQHTCTSDGRVNIRLTKNGRIPPRTTQSRRRSSSKSDLLLPPVSS